MRQPQLEEIAAAVTDHYGPAAKDWRARQTAGRSYPFQSEARTVFGLVAQSYGFSRMSAARFLGRDNTTLIYGERRRGGAPEVKQAVADIRRRVLDVLEAEQDLPVATFREAARAHLDHGAPCPLCGGRR